MPRICSLYVGARNPSKRRDWGARMISTPHVRGAGDSTVSASPIRGRDEQLHMIAGFLERVRAGAGGVAIIEGAAGLGKTRLLAAARATARALSFRTGLGAAEPGHSSVELAVLMEALFGGTESLVGRNALDRATAPGRSRSGCSRMCRP